MALDAATAAYLASLAQAGAPALYELAPQEARALYAARRLLLPPGPEMSGVREELLTGADGGQFRVRVLVPDGKVRAVITYYHGGGWVVGDIDDFDALGRTIAARFGAAVVLADYRLAPEYPYPCAADDAFAALEWAGKHAAEIAGAPVPLIVMGDSAGGNLAAVTALRSLRSGGPALGCQVLIYPVTDAEFDNDSYRDPDNQLVLTRESMIWFWDLYLPDQARRHEPGAAPLRATDLAGLPPTIVVTAEYDVLRQEGEAYAARLRDAGVPVTLRRFAGQMHGFFALAGILPGSAEAIGYLAEELSRQLAAASPGPA